MKNGTLILLAALAAVAGVVWYVMRPSMKPAATPTGTAARPTTTSGAQVAAINTGIDLVGRAGGALIDWLARPSATTTIDLGNGTGTADPVLADGEGY